MNFVKQDRIHTEELIKLRAIIKKHLIVSN